MSLMPIASRSPVLAWRRRGVSASSRRTWGRSCRRARGNAVTRGRVLPKFNTSPEIRRAEGPTTRIPLIMVNVQCLGECGAILRGEYWGAPRSEAEASGARSSQIPVTEPLGFCCPIPAVAAGGADAIRRGVPVRQALSTARVRTLPASALGRSRVRSVRCRRAACPAAEKWRPSN
jgi:hypothetical protein